MSMRVSKSISAMPVVSVLVFLVSLRSRPRLPDTPMSRSCGGASYRRSRMRIGALDLGSNSFHLLVADVHPDGTFESIAREKDMLRLGDEVARNGQISETTVRRVVDSVRHMKQLADASGATEVIAKATSAIRSAANGSDVVDQ